MWDNTYNMRTLNNDHAIIREASQTDWRNSQNVGAVEWMQRYVKIFGVMTSICEERPVDFAGESNLPSATTVTP